MEVDNFQIGRTGCGVVEFPGLSDLRGIDLDKIFHMEAGMVSVYLHTDAKPRRGQGLNKAAVITLALPPHHEVHTDALKEKYCERLRLKTIEEGAQFISYDFENWRFRVNHFV